MSDQANFFCKVKIKDKHSSSGAGNKTNLHQPLLISTAELELPFC